MKFLFILLVPLLLIHCSTGKNFDDASLYPTEESFLNAVFGHSLNEHFSLNYDQEIFFYLLYLSNTFNHKQAGHGSKTEINLVAVNNPTVNAIALPGGRIYITTALLRAVESESALIGVVAHETCHIENHDLLKRWQLRDLPHIPLFHDFTIEELSWEQELEADRCACAFLKENSHSPESYLDFLRWIHQNIDAKQSVGNNSAELPNANLRLASLEAFISSIGKVKKEKGSSRFFRRMKSFFNQFKAEEYK